jgi:hypothetical protein
MLRKRAEVLQALRAEYSTVSCNMCSANVVTGPKRGGCRLSPVVLRTLEQACRRDGVHIKELGACSEPFHGPRFPCMSLYLQ